MLSTKALSAAVYHIDPLLAEKYASERYNLLSDCGYCVDPSNYNYDMYNREAHPYSLPNRQQGGLCGNLDPYNGIQALITRENNITRPFIPFSPCGGMYDTMAVGRDFMNTCRGGMGCGMGGWKKMNMPKNAACCEYNVENGQYPMRHPCPNSLSESYSLHYSG